MADLGDADQARSGAIDLHSPQASHIADILIAERGEKLVNSRFWPLIKPVLYKILHYDDAVRMADELGPLPGQAAMNYVSRLLSLDLDISGLERLPRSGAVIIAANHPTGIADPGRVWTPRPPSKTSS